MEEIKMSEQAGVVRSERGRMNLEALRFSYDAQLSAKILKVFGSPALGVDLEKSVLLNMRRRHLLGDAVLLTHELVPEVARAFAQCLRALGISEQAGGLYVQQCAEYNANVMSDGERFDIVVNSALLRDFSIPELRFVIGHELGHVLFKHNDISLPGLFGAHEEMDEEDAMLLFSWSRSAEISADRVGLVCAGGVDPAVSAMFKLSSGLTGIPVEAMRASMRHQFEQLKRHIADVDHDDHNDRVRTHPMSPIRFRSLELAVKHIAAIFTGDASEKPASLIKLDQNIEALLEAIESNGRAARGFYAASGQEMLCQIMLCVALASGVVSRAHHAFMCDTCVALGAKFSVAQLLAEVGADWRGCRARLLDRLHASVEAELLTREELRRAFALTRHMVSDGERGHALAIFQLALDEIAQRFHIEGMNLPRISTSQHLTHAMIREVLDVQIRR